MISIMMRLATSATRLLVIVIRAASTAAGAVFKETRSFSTEHSLHRWSGRVFSRTTGRATNHRCSGKPCNHRFTVLRSCYELTNMLRRTLTYALGPRGSARRENAWVLGP